MLPSPGSVLICHVLSYRCLQTSRRGPGRRRLCQSADVHQPHNQQRIRCQGRPRLPSPPDVKIVPFCTDIWTTCSLHGVPVGSCLFWVSSLFSFFPPLTVQRLILFAVPSHHCFHPVAAYGRAGRDIHTPYFLPVLPPGVASTENIVFWPLCQNKNPQRGRRGAARVVSVCLHCFLLCTVPLFLCFPARLGVDLAAYFDFLEFPFLLWISREHFFSPFRIMNSSLNCNKVQLGLVLPSIINHKRTTFGLLIKLII